MYILGFSIGHDKGAVLIKDGKILIGITEERLSRIKHDGAYSHELPKLSIDYCLKEYKLIYSDIDQYIYTTTEIEDYVESKFSQLTGLSSDRLKYIPHHLAHATCTFYSSAFDDAAVVVADAMGSILSEHNQLKEWYTDVELSGDNSFNWAEGYAIYHFKSTSEVNEVYKKWIKFPIPDDGEGEEVSIGFSYSRGSKQLIYSPKTNTWSAGKLMGLASFADPEYVSKYETDNVYSEYDMSVPAGSIMPEVDYRSDFASKANVAGLYQKKQVESCVHLSKIAKNITDSKNLCVAGGSFLNCNTNETLLKSGMYENYYFIAPADDSGIPLGCALYGSFDKTEKVQLNPYLGRTYKDSEVLETLFKFRNIKFEKFDDFDKLTDVVSNDLVNNKVVGWFQGGSEIGPRALGNRSILASPIQSWMIDYINSEIKQREWYRPFAPSILFEYQTQVFDLEEYSPHMLITCTAKEEWRSRIPSVVHSDGTSRVQSVTPENNEKYYSLIECFHNKTNVPLVLNTSFNGPSEPIVETPLDAINTFLNIGLYSLVINNFYITKR